MHATLDISTDATHDVLRRRLRKAIAGHSVAQHSRGEYPATDDFLSSTSRHLAAVSAAIVPAARKQLDDGAERAKELVQQSRHLELAMAKLKARLYGEAHVAQITWGELWTDARDELERTLELERRLVDDLLARLDDDHADELAGRLYHAELHAPTRPHPYAPHVGLTGRVARRVLTTVDHFWDTTEGRMVPEPVRPRDHTHDGLLTHYLLADPDPVPEGEEQAD
ncbi:hypothetical protein [Nocardioides terrisoli]|uniref:hypothetical protein n=1 Tax=Nocardioides terrisoli TaxID=3388267 RepID=UPI00287BC7D8|nr:hypothetical protein [Nocardioides marmorisolisilvae]